MAEADGDPGVTDTGQVSEEFLKRQADVVLEPVEPDISTSDEAMKILMEQGVDAYRKWLAEQPTG